MHRRPASHRAIGSVMTAAASRATGGHGPPAYPLNTRPAVQAAAPDRAPLLDFGCLSLLPWAWLGGRPGSAVRGKDDVALDVGRRRSVRDVPDRAGRRAAFDDDGLCAALAGDDKLACVYPRPGQL